MQNSPFISIILPIRNESAYIERCLQSILVQDYPGQMEILVVDGLSTDNTREIISEFSVEHPQPQIHILDNPGRIVPTGMNIALRQAKGEIIIRVDGHCLIAPDYVSKCVMHIQKGGADGVGGPMETIGETYIAKLTALGMSSPFGVGNSAFRTTSGKTMPADTAPFPAYTREIIHRAGFYDEELMRNQDDEYNYRIRKLGGKILLADDVRSAYFSRASLKNLWRQYYQYGLYKVRVLQKHPLQMSLRQFVPPAFVLALLVSALFELPLFSYLYPSSFILHPFPFILHPFPLILLSYLSANLAASIHTASKRGWEYLPLLPLVFAILHISYGLGFLAGLIKFWNRWGDKTGRTPAFSNSSHE